MSDTLHIPRPLVRNRASLMARFGLGGRARDEELRHMAALAASAPFAHILVEREGHIMPSAEALALLKLADHERTLNDLYRVTGDRTDSLRAGVERLLSDGLAFETVLTIPDTGARIAVTGRQGQFENARVATLWLQDLTAGETEKQRREAQLGEVQREVQIHRASLAALDFPVWRRDQRGKLIWCNEAYARALDTNVKEVIAEQNEIAGTLRDRVGRALWERSLRDGKSAAQSKHIVIGGARRFFEFLEVPNESGTLGFAFDLTQIDDLQANLSRHIASHAEVLETLTTAVAVFGADQKIHFHNSAFCNLWGLEETWLSTHPTLSQVLEYLRDDRQLPEQADFRSFKQGWLAMFTSLIEPHQELMYRPDGSAIRLAIVPHPMGGLLFTFEDVTSRLALESSYNTLIAVQRETLDNLAEGIVVFGGDGRIDLWNPAFARMWNLVDEELANRPHVAEIVERLAPEMQSSKDGADLKRLLISNAVERLPQRGSINRADGTVLEYHSVLLPDGGVLNSFLDATDRSRVELALRDRNAALIAADQLKLDFLANVSYQLRTPLNAMIGFTEILIKQFFGALNDKQMEYARGTLEAGERLVMLVDAILDLSTIEAGYMRLHTAPVFVDDILDDILALAEDWADKQEVSLEVDCPADIGTIEADERRLKQVLLNLISNALKFTPTGGKIMLSARRETSAAYGEEIMLSVTDTGAGIPQADQARVFEPFESGKRKLASSAGVGLALVKSFISLHGGRVELKSEPGSGTSVICHLPAKQPQRGEEG